MNEARLTSRVQRETTVNSALHGATRSTRPGRPPARAGTCRIVSYIAFGAFQVVVAVHLPVHALETAPQFRTADPQLSPSDALFKLNGVFRSAYTELRSNVLKVNSPVIIHQGDKMMFISNGLRVEAPSITSRYHELKSVAHVPLALYSMLTSGVGSKMKESDIEQLREYRALVVLGRESINERSFTPDQKDRQSRILNRSLALIDSVLKEGMLNQADLLRFSRSQQQDLLTNAYEAAEDQIATMDRQVMIWLAELSPQERERLRVVVGTVHMARVGNLAMQYFSVVLNEGFEGRFEQEEIQHGNPRLVCAEATFDEQGLLNILGTHIVDAEVGDCFFGDDQRMHRDLLADAAEEIITKKFGRKKSRHQ